MAEIRGIDAAIDLGAGASVYVVEQDITNSKMYVKKRTLDGGTEESSTDFGSATEAEIDAGTYSLYIYTYLDPAEAGQDDVALAFGDIAGP